MEEYKGVKFPFDLIDGEIPEKEKQKFLELDRKLGAFINPEENEGNLSMRLTNGFLIKGAGAIMTRLSAEEVSMVISINEKVIASGAVPSSEARMHYEIYKAQPKAKIILHFHDKDLLGRFDGPSIGPFDYGTEELAVAAGKINEKMFMIKEHGFVIIARDEEELFRLIRWKR